MTKLDLALIQSKGDGRPVPLEMDRHIVKFVVGNRKNAVDNNPELLLTERWDHSDVFYASRTLLNQHGWDTSVYNDNTKGGSARRKKLYDMIQDVCERTYGVKRHQIGIHPDERAVMAYGGRLYAASFDNLRSLMFMGSDVNCVEKQGTVIKMMPFTKGNGVAFIQSQGFISEHGVALARLGNGDYQAGLDYLNHNVRKVSKYTRSNLGNLTDCDSSGIVIGMKVKGAMRLGIDLDTIDEINQVNKGLGKKLGIKLPIKLEDLEESNEENNHWRGLYGVVTNDSTGKLYKSLSEDERIFYRRYLRARPKILGGNITFLDYLKEHRIELNTVLGIVKPQAFWNWLRWKILQVWPNRNYVRTDLNLSDDKIRTPTMNRFIDYCYKQTQLVAQDRIGNERLEMRKVEGMYDDEEGFMDNTTIVKRAIMTDIMNEEVLQNEGIQKLDLALENLMKDGNGGGNGDKIDDDDNNDDNDDDDGNDWLDAVNS